MCESEAAQNQNEVRDNEDHEDRHQRRHRLLHASYVEDDEQRDDEKLKRQLPCVPGQGQHVEHGIATGGDGHGDSQDVVDQQRRAGEQAGLFAEQLARHHVAAAAGGKVLDDAAIGVGHHEHGQRSGQRHEHREIRRVAVFEQGAERLVRSVGRG